MWPLEKAARLPTLVTRELWGFLIEPWCFLQSSRAHHCAAHKLHLLLQLTVVAVPLGSAAPAPPFPLGLCVAFSLVTAADSGTKPEWVSTVELSSRAYIAVHLSWARVLLSVWDAAPGWWACLKLSQAKAGQGRELAHSCSGAWV